ncbi:calcium-translocating P-type ATPase, PMCA-type [Candidatus Curtissbacteria bacterium]|nr:calcium-translocating P-type ATPase, PMCA-type [Candidatus Curtissbacteria bacterium]
MDKPYYQQTEDEVLKILNSQRSGLSEQEASDRLAKYGPNQLTAKKKVSALAIYLEQFKNSLILILIGSTILILFIYFFGNHDPQDLIEASLIFAIVIMITFLGFFQEYKAEKSIEALKKLLAFKAKVIRDGNQKEVDVKNLVPGDIVVLDEGEKVPADIRLLEVYSLRVNEASLTGESNPIDKTEDPIKGEKSIGDRQNMVFSATSVTSGKATGVVVQTGDNTEIGKIANQVAQVKEDKTPIQKRLDQIGKSIGYIILGICAFVFIFIVFFAHDFATQSLIERVIHSFIASVALAVAAIPEGLPAVVTIALAIGTRRMLKRNALVRKLNSVETLGSTDVICADKTGTLTKNEMTVTKIYFDGKTYAVSGSGYDTNGDFTQNGKPQNPKNLELILRAGLNCNNAEISEEKIIGDPTEAALIVSAKKAKIIGKSKEVFEIPFTSDRKMMSAIVEDGQKYVVFSKGAPEILLGKCTQIQALAKKIPLTKKEQDQILTVTENMSHQALRTLGFAYKEINASELASFKKNREKIESDLVFIGLQGMIDPPRPEVKPLIETCRQSGIRVMMITGDHVQTAKAVAAEIGLAGEARVGEELDKLNDQQFAKAVRSVNIYARVHPGIKLRIVDVLKKDGHIVAMTGDGVNDAPALKRADIGVAMGITGTDVAKEASDIVLLDDQFSSIVYAIEEGRGIFHNIRKFVTYLLSCNIGEVIAVFLGVMIFQKLPLTATMLLWINVVTDGIPAVALGLDPAEKDILKKSPKDFQTQIISKRLWIEMFIFGLLLAVAVLGIYKINLAESRQDAQGAAFMATVVIELVYIYLIRSSYKTSFFSNPKLIIAVLGTLLIQIAIIYIPFLAKLFEVTHIEISDWLYIGFASIFLWIIFQLVRMLLDKIPVLKSV